MKMNVNIDQSQKNMQKQLKREWKEKKEKDSSIQFILLIQIRVIVRLEPAQLS